MRRAARSPSAGNSDMIHGASGVKIDVFIGMNTEYDRVRFGRRQQLPLVPSRHAYFARAEDAILYTSTPWPEQVKRVSIERGRDGDGGEARCGNERT